MKVLLHEILKVGVTTGSCKQSVTTLSLHVVEFDRG